MKQSLWAIGLVLLFAACEKEAIVPSAKGIDATAPTEKELGNTKEWMSCFIYDANHKPVWDGKICKGEGNECGRKPMCTIPGHFENPGEVLYGNITREEFHALWQTEEGRDYLFSKGFYVVEEGH